jgi:hypothetical protein
MTGKIRGINFLNSDSFQNVAAIRRGCHPKGPRFLNGFQKWRLCRGGESCFVLKTKNIFLRPGVIKWMSTKIVFQDGGCAGGRKKIF